MRDGLTTMGSTIHKQVVLGYIGRAAKHGTMNAPDSKQAAHQVGEERGREGGRDGERERD